MTIRVGKLEFAIKSAELRYTRVPNNTIAVDLDVVGDRSSGLHLTLEPPPLPGRTLADLTGQVQVIASPTRPSLDDPRAVEVVAGIYVGTHEDVYDSRVEWGAVDERGISVRWSGIVDDLDVYDGSMPRQPLRVDAVATVVEVPHRAVTWRITRANEDEHPLLRRVEPSLLSKLSADLAERRWFERMPFVSLELVVQVEARGRRWPVLPPRKPRDPQVVVVKLLRAVVMSGDDAALQRAMEAEIAPALEKLDQEFRQREPRVLL